MPVKKEKKPKKAAKPKAKKAQKPKAKKEKAPKQIGTVSNYFDHVKAAAIKLTAAIKVGDKIKLQGGGNEFEQEIKEMQINRENVEKAKKGDEIGVIVSQKVRKGYKVFKA
jgi:translation initiation factor IF-2